MPAPANPAALSHCLWRVFLVAMLVTIAGELRSAETRPVVGVGATRDEILNAYGWPSGQSQAGEREVFTYPQGQVFLQNGVVERMDFSPNVAWAKPKPRPPPPTASTAPKTATAKPEQLANDGAWTTNFEEARREATRLPGEILALFTGRDWSPPCKRFQAEVAQHPDFLAAVRESFVLLRLDFPTHTTQVPELREQNLALRERFGVTTYPTLMILSADGSEVARVDLAKSRPQPTFREQVIAAIGEAKPKPLAITEWKAPDAAKPSVRMIALGLLDKAGWIAGAIALLAVGWMLLRQREAAPTGAETGPGTLMPTPADIATWPQDRVRDMAAKLFEYEGSKVKVRPTESGAELALFHAVDGKSKALVRCQSAAAGLAGAASVKDLFGTTIAEGVETAWYVSPGGFTVEARQFAQEHGIVLIGGEDLLQRLKDVPPMALLRILSASN